MVMFTLKLSYLCKPHLKSFYNTSETCNTWQIITGLVSGKLLLVFSPSLVHYYSKTPDWSHWRFTNSLLDINEHSPQYNNGGSYTDTVSEDTAVGALVTSVTAIDNDLGSEYGEVTYNITSGNDDDMFYIKPTNGSVYLKRALDRETMASYTLSIMATDLDPVSPKSSTATLLLTVQDVNDNAPDCDPSIHSATLLESVAIGTTVVQVTCSDRDVAPNAITSYSITSGE